MINIEKVILTFLCSIIPMMLSAQIGYQVSLLNNATGEPRSNESVSVRVKITDSNGNVICEETKKATSNDFGVVSLSVGNSETFANADWANLPLFIEASVDNRLLGRSQILSVPVAEYAKRTGILTKEILCSKSWEWHSSYHDEFEFYRFYDDGTCSWGYSDYEGVDATKGKYVLDGNTVILIGTGKDEGFGSVLKYVFEDNVLCQGSLVYK